ncbi:MAG: ABC-type Fe3+-siderophore transport system, permease component [Anaerocolumna sp.]|jgi:iron complex transport system permease protein|nr:ABC-type Fe3+-siderophore transport system, permease component [Anaerocolumna sp.]
MYKANERARKNTGVIIFLLLILILTIIVSIGIGKYAISPSELIGIILSNFIDIKPYWTDRMEVIFYNIRFPRIMLAILVGCCHATAGAAYQGIFQNPMASPDILGASAGAAFGAALAIMNDASSREITISAFFFSVVAVLFVHFMSKRVKGNRILGLILSGIMISSLVSAGTSYLKLVADPNDQLPAITYWLMGSLSGTKSSDVTFAIIPMLLGLIPIFLLRWQLNVLTLGDEEAKTIGIDTQKIRLIIILSATLLTASSVSVSGMIGWIGLIIPHLSRFLVGNDYRYLIPTSMLFGSVFLLIVDNVSRMLWTNEIPIGILTAFIGAPFFLYLITREDNIS